MTRRLTSSPTSRAGQRVLEGLHGSGHVALEDEQELLALALLHLGHEVLEGTATGAPGVHRCALTGIALLRDLASDPVVVDDQEVVASAGSSRETEHHDGSARRCVADRVTVLVEHGPNSPVRGSGDDGVADVQRSALHQDGGNRASTAVEVSLDHQTLRILVGVGPQIQRGVGRQHDRLEELVDVQQRLGRDVDEHGVAAVLLRHQAVLGELTAHLRGVGVLLVDLVDGDHDRHVGRLCVVERLDRLRHDAVVGGHHENGDVGRLARRASASR